MPQYKALRSSDTTQHLVSSNERGFRQTRSIAPLAALGLITGALWQAACSSDPEPAGTSTNTAATNSATTNTPAATTSTATTGGATSTTSGATGAETVTTATTTTSGTTGGLPDGVVYAPCINDNAVGSFLVSIGEGFSRVTGNVNDKKRITPPLVEAEAEGCQLRVSQAYVCTPECAVGTTCSPASVCEAQVMAVDVGTVGVTGLGLDGTGSVSMTPGAQGYYQAVVPAPPHPAFAPGATLSLSASGNVVEAFSLQTKGVDDLAVLMSEVPAAADMPVALTWTPPSSPQGKIHIVLDVGHHGGSPAEIVCDVDDDGEFQIPQPLVSQLFDYGVWGFPGIELSRRAIGSTTVSTGCVDFVAEAAPVALPVSIEGVVSCNTVEDCTGANEVCQGLRCIVPE